MPRRLLLALVVVLAVALGLKLGGVLDQEPDPVAEVVDLSFDVRERLDALRAELGFPGATAAFVLPDGRSGRVAVGVLDPDGDEPMPVDARMPAGSVGRMFVAGVVLDLVGRGVLDLDAPVSRWLGDEPRFQRLSDAPDLTLRNLMNHASGMPDHPEQPSLLACLVVEKATGRAYEDLARERLLEPLGLTETVPARSDMVSTSNDLARYVHRLARGTALDWDYRPDLLQGPELDASRGPGRSGLAIDVRRGDLGTTLGHTGSSPGYHSAVTHYVDHGVTVAVQVNRDRNTEVRRLADELARLISRR